MIQYTSRTFNTVLADINADPLLVDTPDWWKRMVAGIMDVLSVIENASANQSFLRTAFTRRAVYDLAALIDYTPVEKQTSSGTLLFDISPTASPPFTVLKSNLAALFPGSVATPSMRFEARADLNVTALTEVTASASWDTGTDRVTVAAVFTTGEKVRLSFSATPPTTIPQVVAGVDYYAIYVDATHIRVATSRANALAGTYIDITAQGTGNHTFTRLSRSVVAYQQTSVAAAAIGTSDGSTAWQEFPIPRVGVIAATLAITINSVSWTKVTTFVNSGPTDKHFRLIYQTDDTCLVQFGDGTYGQIPGGFDVVAEYAYGGGVTSNVSALGAVSVYAGADANLVGVFNPGALTGGADAEALAVTKRLAPLLLKARDRFVTSEDGESLALNYGGLSLVQVNRNVYGPLSAQVVAIANGGGNPSSGLRTAIQQYLIDRSILESIDVRFEACTITAVAVTSAAKMKSGYTWAAVEPYFRLAWRLLLTETGQEIADSYQDGGVAATVTLINAIFGTSFGAADYAAIERMLVRLEPRQFGEDIQSSDAFAFVQGAVEGVDYMTVSAPSFPVAVADNEITTPGTLTLTEIP